MEFDTRVTFRVKTIVQFVHNELVQFKPVVMKCSWSQIYRDACEISYTSTITTEAFGVFFKCAELFHY